MTGSTCIDYDLQRTFVMRVREGKTEWVDVKTGVTANGQTEVFGELQAGELVVRNATDPAWNSRLRESDIIFGYLTVWIPRRTAPKICGAARIRQVAVHKNRSQTAWPRGVVRC